ncbi:very-long-chain (3R)-3-hydroxyacyl-CoA dehydratase 3 [Octopus sinensis]|uniref:Very-long-chain (3R)-3-hydroxyacyl-CoA dehydratase n=1 Tax=Octopus sinensis TaxID=2607531 RepID=A0A6P7T0P5_9MOLL|nr:very-long-chain (3R)-3-hydroxyacyl-CoA dehydratase 3 [Octopus sinensis]
MAEPLRPFVYWGQKNDHVSLKVDLRDVCDETIEITEDSVSFNAIGQGVRGENVYCFNIDFYLPVESEKSFYRISDRAVEFRFQKRGIGEVWPRLTYKSEKQQWLKIDFDKFALEEDSDDKPEYEPSKTSIMKKLESDLKQVEVKSSINFNYLFLYNLFQFMGYSYICGIMQYHYYRYGEDSKLDIYETLGSQLITVQIISCLEILHPLLGIVRSSVIASFFQVMGRNFILLLVACNSHLQQVPSFWYLVLVWSFAEVIRYPYYMLQSIKREATLITWLRYSAWIVLYPLGLFLEGTIVLAGAPMYEISGKFTLTLPNNLNFSFYFPWFLRVYLFSLIPATYMLLNHMYKLRKSKLATFSIGFKKKK